MLLFSKLLFIPARTSVNTHLPTTNRDQSDPLSTISDLVKRPARSGAPAPKVRLYRGWQSGTERKSNLFASARGGGGSKDVRLRGRLVVSGMQFGLDAETCSPDRSPLPLPSRAGYV